MKPTKKFAKDHGMSEGDSRDHDARRTSLPGQGRTTLKKGLDAFWKKHEPASKKPPETKRKPRGDTLITNLADPVSDDHKRAVIVRYLTLLHEYAFSPDNAFQSAIGYDLFEKTRKEFLEQRGDA